MSSPNNYTLYLTQDARADLESILMYTEQQWGSDQRQKYAGLVDTALTAIEADPQIGRPRPQLPQHYRLYHVERHYIVIRCTLL